jgi:molybdopterin synthase sulfur carrier subunit
VTVIFYGYIQRLTGVKELEYKGSAKNINELIEELSVMYGKEFRNYVFDSSGIKKGLIILVNGKNIYHLNGTETPIVSRDQVQILPVAVGG